MRTIGFYLFLSHVWECACPLSRGRLLSRQVLSARGPKAPGTREALKRLRKLPRELKCTLLPIVLGTPCAKLLSEVE